MSFQPLRVCSALGAAMLCTATIAQNLPPPEGVVSLSSSATLEVTKDLLSVAFSATRDGQDAGQVQSQLKQALDAALAEARKVAKPGAVEVQAGNFSLYPRYSAKGSIVGWSGTAELGVEGRDMAAIGQLTGRITSMTIARVGYNLSRELREKVEGDVTAQAIARYQAKAADYAKQFGYRGYVLREVNVSAGDVPNFMPSTMVRAKAMSAASDEALAVEPGKGAVTVSVNGTVQLTK
jgi:predicted secreted protein